MNPDLILNISSIFGLMILLIPSCYTDIKKMEVHTGAIVASALSAVTLFGLASINYSDMTFIWRLLIGAGVGTVIGFILFIAGMGFGDFKIMIVLGAWTGIIGFGITLAIASILASLYGLIWKKGIKKQSLKTEFPFVPFLTAGAFIYLILSFTFGIPQIL